MDTAESAHDAAPDAGNESPIKHRDSAKDLSQDNDPATAMTEGEDATAGPSNDYKEPESPTEDIPSIFGNANKPADDEEMAKDKDALPTPEDATAEDHNSDGKEPLKKKLSMRELLSSFITEMDMEPRNEGKVPLLHWSSHRLLVDGMVRRPGLFTMSFLRHGLKQHNVICALRCAGNKRHPGPDGTDRHDDVVMNCVWTGPRLKDVLAAAGGVSESLQDPATKEYRGHAAFISNAQLAEEDEYYGAAIPLQRALNWRDDVILALGMNGKPLTPERGHPLRVVVPGVAGARSVKWLSKITVQEKNSQNFYQYHEKRVIPNEYVDKKLGLSLWRAIDDPMSEMPIKSVVGWPESGSTVHRDKHGFVEAKGYALPQGSDGPIQVVEVSGDGGSTWIRATLEYGRSNEGSAYDPRKQQDRKHIKWSWCLWTANVRMTAGTDKRILCRAIDTEFNRQKEQSEWNKEGLVSNGWGCSDNLTVV